jgi:ribosome-associated protein
MADLPDYPFDADAVELSFIRASGPGGQNVNKVSTAVQLRFNVWNAALPDPVKERLIRLAGKKMTNLGDLILTANRFRTQERNREDALARLAALVEKAKETQAPRKATRPSRAAKARRVDAKVRRAGVKAARSRVRDDEG